MKIVCENLSISRLESLCRFEIHDDCSNYHADIVERSI